MAMRLAADTLLLLHAAYILFVVFGGLLVIRRPALKWLHLPAALWGALVELGGWGCPLTRWENFLRGRAGGTGFIDYYVRRAIYPSGLTRGIELALGAAVVTINIAIYVYAFRHSATPRLHDGKTV
jgi:Protein of Unknown function (DUF2784)